MPNADGSAEPEDRCVACDLDAGRCQLTRHHGGPHAVRVDDAFLTWDLHDVSRWSTQKPALWLFDLSWARGLHPPVRPTGAA